MKSLKKLDKNDARNVNGGKLLSIKARNASDTAYANSMYSQLNHHAFRHFSYQRPSTLLRADFHML